MREGRAGRFLLEPFPAGETSAILDDEECVESGSCLLRDGVRDPVVEAACRHGSYMMGRFVQRGKEREFKALLGEFFQGNVDQIGQIFFGFSSLEHGFEQTRARGGTIRFELLDGPDEGDMLFVQSQSWISRSRSRMIFSSAQPLISATIAMRKSLGPLD